MLSKEEFVKIINRLKGTNDAVKKINRILREDTDCIVSDFTQASSLMICHEDIAVNLLEKIFDDNDIISWWLYDLDYGTKYKDGYIKDENGNDIDLSTAEKLYDYLVKDREENRDDNS